MLVRTSLCFCFCFWPLPFPIFCLPCVHPYPGLLQAANPIRRSLFCLHARPPSRPTTSVLGPTRASSSLAATNHRIGPNSPQGLAAVQNRMHQHHRLRL
ncbi:hypothetical protein V8C43DRAFT_61782 [Trichoderma afarasin]